MKTKEVRMKQMMIGACMAVSLTVGAATEYQWVPGATDWSSASSYADSSGGSIGAKLPAAGDILAIPDDCEVMLDTSNAAHFEQFNRFSCIRPLGLGARSTLKIFVADGDVKAIEPRIRYADSYTARDYGVVVKVGPGTLKLGSGLGATAYATSFTVEAGTLKLPTACDSWSYLYYGKVRIERGATVCAPTSSGTALFSPLSITGEGGLIYDGESGSCMINTLMEQPFEFAGRISGSIGIHNTVSRMCLTGTASDFSGSVNTSGAGTDGTSGACIGVGKFGMKGGASSLGTSGTLNMKKVLGAETDAQAGGFLYLGEGEVTDKDFLMMNSRPGPNVLDAGAVGGVTFRGAMKVSTYPLQLQTLVITGSNTLPCRVEGPVDDYDFYGSLYNVNIIKRGTGTWRFTDVPTMDMSGLFSVENGTLQYDSIAETNVLSSLGTSRRPRINSSGALDDAKDVPYAFALGSEDADADPVFEYVGSGTGWALTRSIVLKGDAHLRHSGSGELRLAGVKSLSAGAKTLTLDGAGADAWLYNLEDGAGRVSLAKDGTGTWTIAGTNAISGTVDVRGGTLRIQGGQAPYTWFRFVSKDIYRSQLGSGDRHYTQSSIKELGLYDAAGKRVNGGLTRGTTLATYDHMKDLAPGQFSFGSTKSATDGDNPSALMFDGDPNTCWWSQTGSYPNPSFESDWVKIVMRLPAGAAEVDSFDLLQFGGWSWQKDTASINFTLEGSLDGVHWDLLNESAFTSPVTGDESWRFAGTYAGTGKTTDVAQHKGGQKVAGHPVGLPVPFAKVTAVSVAPGARLESSCGSIAFASGMKLKIDGSGSGTIAGFEFPDDGTLEFVNVPKFSGSLDISVPTENVEGWSNLSAWSFTVNGQPTESMTFRIDEGKITLQKKGLVITFR